MGKLRASVKRAIAHKLDRGETYKASAARMIRAGQQPRDARGRFASTGTARLAGLNVPSKATETSGGRARRSSIFDLTSQRPYSERFGIQSAIANARAGRDRIEQHQADTRRATTKTSHARPKIGKTNTGLHAAVAGKWKGKSRKKPGKLTPYRDKDDPTF